MSKEKWSGINPLSQHDIKVLDSLGLDDTRRKINELAEEVTKIKEQCFFGKEMTVNVCNGKEPYDSEKAGLCSKCGERLTLNHFCTPSIDKTEREEGVYYPEKIAEQWGECCDKCHDVTFDKTYPAHTAYHACMNLKCDCHKPKEPIKDWKPIFTNALHEYEEEGANDTTFLFSEVERIIEQIRQEEREKLTKIK